MNILILLNVLPRDKILNLVSGIRTIIFVLGCEFEVCTKYPKAAKQQLRYDPLHASYLYGYINIFSCSPALNVKSSLF